MLNKKQQFKPGDILKCKILLCEPKFFLILKNDDNKERFLKYGGYQVVNLKTNEILWISLFFYDVVEQLA